MAFYRDHVGRLESHPPPQRLPASLPTAIAEASGCFPDVHSQVALLLTEESLPPPEWSWPCTVPRQPRRNVNFRCPLPVCIDCSADHDLPACLSRTTR